MRFIATLNNKEHEIHIKKLEGDSFNVILDGQEYGIDAYVMPSGIVSLIADGKSYDVDVDQKNLSVQVRGKVFNLEILNERQHKLKSAKSASSLGSSSSEVRAPMPGRILRILVEEGDLVEEGQGLLVMEAMKMENEIRASKAGVVTGLQAKAGASVESGACLLIID